MKLTVTHVYESQPTLSPDYRFYTVFVTVHDVWAEELDGTYAWIAETFNVTDPEAVVDDDAKCRVEFITRLPARSEEELTSIVEQITPLVAA